MEMIKTFPAMNGPYGDMLFPDGSGKNQPIDRPGNISSIQQIRKTALQGQEHKSVEEILYSKLGLSISEQNTSNKTIKVVQSRKWWQKFFRF
ncbi:MAG: hypothetical protein JST42_02575 [Bacteroidetes bacterium]|nr:hypothetical protein [Bacteroidota bacterium]